MNISHKCHKGPEATVMVVRLFLQDDRGEKKVEQCMHISSSILCISYLASHLLNTCPLVGTSLVSRNVIVN